MLKQKQVTPTKMEKIVIAIDYHPTSEKVAEKGFNLAKQLGAEVCLLHVIAENRYYGMEYPSFLGYDGYSYPIDLTINTELEKVANNYLAQAAAHLNNEVTTHLAKGETASTILNYAENWNADLIVMGTHSHSTLEKLLIGTETSKVIENTDIPVFLVPIKKEY